MTIQIMEKNENYLYFLQDRAPPLCDVAALTPDS
jgi:hypothetical protein